MKHLPTIIAAIVGLCIIGVIVLISTSLSAQAAREDAYRYTVIVLATDGHEARRWEHADLRQDGHDYVIFRDAAGQTVKVSGSYILSREIPSTP